MPDPKPLTPHQVCTKWADVQDQRWRAIREAKGYSISGVYKTARSRSFGLDDALDASCHSAVQVALMQESRRCKRKERVDALWSVLRRVYLDGHRPETDDQRADKRRLWDVVRPYCPTPIQVEAV